MRGERSAKESTGSDKGRAAARRTTDRRLSWLPEDLDIAERYARAITSGRYRSAPAAAPNCKSELAGRHTLDAVKQRLRLLARAMGRSEFQPPWTPDEKAVVNRFARAIVQRRYRNVKEALPDCQRERRRVAPTIERTDVALAWKVLCRAYDLGLPRRKHFWTEEELRLLKRHAAALARGRYPDILTAANAYKTARERAGLAVRHQDGSICLHLSVQAHALGYVSPRVMPSPGPEERRIIAGFSRALARGEFSAGRQAVPDCLHALGPFVPKWMQRKDRLAALINAGARKIGWQAYRQWDEQDAKTMRRFARALAGGRYATMAAASHACLRSLPDAGRRNLQELNVRCRLSRCYADMYSRLWQAHGGTAGR
jgi:hypothetical protein